jgi:hypothetical protein
MMANESLGKSSRKKRKWLKKIVPWLNRVVLTWRWSMRRWRCSEKYAGPVPLVVSLTSYPPRFPTLHLTLRSLLLQRLQPTRVVLWIAFQDAQRLPPVVTALQAEGLEIRLCEDIKSYKKIIPTLEAEPNAIIVTADDDIYYWVDWLRELFEQSQKHPEDVIAHRVHRMKTMQNRIESYREWQESVADQEVAPTNFATGIGGVLYPPQSLHPEVTDRQKFMQLCPNADDVWLYWMTRRNGRHVRRSATRRTPYPWQGSQEVALWKENRTQNDVQIANMVGAYGLP